VYVIYKYWSNILASPLKACEIFASEINEVSQPQSLERKEKLRTSSHQFQKACTPSGKYSVKATLIIFSFKLKTAQRVCL
jgi:hypothetical protein